MQLGWGLPGVGAAGGATAPGGDVELLSGAGGAVSGGVSVSTAVSPASGNMTFATGNGPSGPSGVLSLSTGYSIGAGAGGDTISCWLWAPV